MFDADGIIYEAVQDALPAYSVGRRREVLQALAAKLNHTHPAFQDVNAQIALLDAVDALQEKLSLHFTRRKS